MFRFQAGPLSTKQLVFFLCLLVVSNGVNGWWECPQNGKVIEFCDFEKGWCNFLPALAVPGSAAGGDGAGGIQWLHLDAGQIYGQNNSQGWRHGHFLSLDNNNTNATYGSQAGFTWWPPTTTGLKQICIDFALSTNSFNNGSGLQEDKSNQSKNESSAHNLPHIEVVGERSDGSTKTMVKLSNNTQFRWERTRTYLVDLENTNSISFISRLTKDRASVNIDDIMIKEALWRTPRTRSTDLHPSATAPTSPLPSSSTATQTIRTTPNHSETPNNTNLISMNPHAMSCTATVTVTVIAPSATQQPLSPSASPSIQSSSCFSPTPPARTTTHRSRSFNVTTKPQLINRTNNRVKRPLNTTQYPPWLKPRATNGTRSINENTITPATKPLNSTQYPPWLKPRTNQTHNLHNKTVPHFYTQPPANSTKFPPWLNPRNGTNRTYNNQSTTRYISRSLSSTQFPPWLKPRRNGTHAIHNTSRTHHMNTTGRPRPPNTRKPHPSFRNITTTTATGHHHHQHHNQNHPNQTSNTGSGNITHAGDGNSTNGATSITNTTAMPSSCPCSSTESSDARGLIDKFWTLSEHETKIAIASLGGLGWLLFLILLIIVIYDRRKRRKIGDGGS